jgi:hypothetical protein
MTPIRVDSSFATDKRKNETLDRDSDACADYTIENSTFVGSAEEPVINSFFWQYRSFPHILHSID